MALDRSFVLPAHRLAFNHSLLKALRSLVCSRVTTRPVLLRSDCVDLGLAGLYAVGCRRNFLLLACCHWVGFLVFLEQAVNKDRGALGERLKGVKVNRFVRGVCAASHAT